MEGKTIAITRSEEDSEEFAELVSNENAIPIALPTIELVTKGEKIVDELLESIKQDDPDYSVFMSSKAVKLLFAQLQLPESRLNFTNSSFCCHDSE